MRRSSEGGEAEGCVRGVGLNMANGSKANMERMVEVLKEIELKKREKDGGEEEIIQEALPSMSWERGWCIVCIDGRRKYPLIRPCAPPWYCKQTDNRDSHSGRG